MIIIHDLHIVLHTEAICDGSRKKNDHQGDRPSQFRPEDAKAVDLGFEQAIQKENSLCGHDPLSHSLLSP